MRKAYTLLIALVLSVLGVISVNAASQFVDLDVKSFRAWDGFGPRSTTSITYGMLT